MLWCAVLRVVMHPPRSNWSDPTVCGSPGRMAVPYGPMCKLHVVAASHSNLCQWMLHGVQSPDLQQLALMVFFIPATSW